MAYSYDRRKIALAVGPGSVEKWRSDLRKMTKIYRSIPAAPEEARLDLFMEAKQLFNTFDRNFNFWIYEDLLPSRDPQKQTYREREVAKSAWAALNAINGIFPSSWNYKTDLHEPAPYQLVRDIDKNVTRYQRAFNAAFKAIDELLEERQLGGKPHLEPIELLHIGPVQVVVHNQGREQRDMEDSLDDELRSLTHAVHRIEQAGLVEAVRELTVHVSFVQTALIAGHYDSGKDELVLFPLGMGRENNETFIHECGHRFYFRSLSERGRAHWKEVIDAHAVIIEKADIDHMVEKYIAPYVAKHNFLPDRKELKRSIREDSVELAAKCREMADHIPAFTSDPEEVRKFWMGADYILGARVNIEEITDYGSTNEKEAFAEAFMLYVTKGPRALGEWTRQFFETVSRSGGAKFARWRAPRTDTITWKVYSEDGTRLATVTDTIFYEGQEEASRTRTLQV